MSEKECYESERDFQQLLENLKNEEMNVFRESLLSLHTYEQGKFYLELDESLRMRFYSYMSPAELAEMFDVLDLDRPVLMGYLSEMSAEYAAAMIGEMSSDNAVDLLHQVGSQEKVEDYLTRMDDEERKVIQDLMHYKDDTAGALMTREFVSIVGSQTVRSAMHVLKSKAEMAETIYYVYVTNQEDELNGVISLKDLIVNDEDALILDIMNERVIYVGVNDDQEDIAYMFRDYDFLALPVVDDIGRLQGIVTVDDIIDVIDDEAASDYSGLAGVNVEEISNNPLCSAWKRLPWLLALLFLGLGTASVINHYEQMMEKGVAYLAVFLMIITGTAGNAGTQSLAVAVRRLALKSDDERSSWGIVISEILTGLITGLIVSLVIFFIVFVWKCNIWFALAVCIAMFMAINVGNLAGSLIPRLMERLGVDPAVASGPFITTFSDLTSVLIYFRIAKLFLPWV
ncbi:MAG: magnesium transporter [Lactobacillales bacterium]|jgi:magnesium transporter|nr:magnesium transporter [Lactobacillales bacterium]